MGGGTLLATSWVIVATTDRVSELEASAFAAVNRLPGVAWPVVWVPMQLGSLVGSLAAVGATWWIGRDRRLTLSALIASQTGYWAAKGVKRVVSRERPRCCCPTWSCVSTPAGSDICRATRRSRSGWQPRWLRRSPPGPASGQRGGGDVAFGRIYGSAHLPLDVAGGSGPGCSRARSPDGRSASVAPASRLADREIGERRPLDQVVALEVLEAEPPREDGEPIGRQAVREDRRHGYSRLHPDTREPGDQHGLERAEPSGVGATAATTDAPR